MNDVSPHLLAEDREEYERILDEALHTASRRPGLEAMGQQLTPEQLRTLALNATALIAAAAATEYQHYVRAREQLNGSASGYESSGTAYSSSLATSADPSAFPRSDTFPAAAEHDVGLGHRFGAAVLGARQPGGRRISDGVAPQRWARMSYGRRLLAALLGLRVRPEVLTAEARTRRTSEQTAAVHTPPRTRPAGDNRELSEELVRAREAWREAVLERGIIPFLREALADPGAAPSPAPMPDTPRAPHFPGRRPLRGGTNFVVSGSSAIGAGGDVRIEGSAVALNHSSATVGPTDEPDRDVAIAELRAAAGLLLEQLRRYRDQYEDGAELVEAAERFEAELAREEPRRTALLRWLGFIAAGVQSDAAIASDVAAIQDSVTSLL
ncbi:hypothetical protein OG453_35025 [Streptomyces sp. NBC_01381]|uniref:hypothetical protein n=1 Tax=Streptomyces sp. NBC_01381 TaxID=2903845 RepID=UPI002258D5E4|nr:hypothetical protein [Streptomyces sp. NBC_01381]MCX4671839.1 hypothetical protein [Streptomyces sp. NBC_01381]